ncbi:MAG: FAD-dependent oxidoreductase, partial [Rubrivivax sp.]
MVVPAGSPSPQATRPLASAGSHLRIAIAGAGLLGRLLALQLSRAGHAVQVFDPAADAATRGAAGWTAAGMLSPVAELESADDDVFAMGVRSLELWPALVAGLPRPVDVHQRGSLLLAHRGDEGAASRVVDLVRAKAPAQHAPQAMTGPQLAELEPDLRGAPHAWLLPHEGQIDTVQAMAALAEGAAAAGAVFRWGQMVDAVTAHHLQAGGQRIDVDWVFDVRGTGARPQLPVRGVRGEILHLHAPGVRLSRPIRLLHPRHRVYIVPRAGE